jgi:D-arabinose 1-dehydrogenase-like Zn-dependent alcohol dehydrogenase
VQVSKVLGARVVAVARGSAKASALRELGADVVIDSAANKDEPLRKLIKVPSLHSPGVY